MKKDAQVEPPQINEIEPQQQIKIEPLTKPVPTLKPYAIFSHCWHEEITKTFKLNECQNRKILNYIWRIMTTDQKNEYEVANPLSSNQQLQSAQLSPKEPTTGLDTLKLNTSIEEANLNSSRIIFFQSDEKRFSTCSNSSKRISKVGSFRNSAVRIIQKSQSGSQQTSPLKSNLVIEI